MPLYDYACYGCDNEFDEVRYVKDADKTSQCPKCGSMAGRIITLGHGGIQRTGDALPWVKDVASVLTDGDEPNKNIETIQDLRRYYQSHPNVVPAESHPSLPSSLGDSIYQKPTPASLNADKAKRARKGREKLRDMRSLSISSTTA